MEDAGGTTAEDAVSGEDAATGEPESLNAPPGTRILRLYWNLPAPRQTLPFASLNVVLMEIVRMED